MSENFYLTTNNMPYGKGRTILSSLLPHRLLPPPIHDPQLKSRSPILSNLRHLDDKLLNSLNLHCLHPRMPAEEGKAKVGVMGLDGWPSFQLQLSTQYAGFLHLIKASPYLQLHESTMQAVQNVRIVAHDE